MTHAATPISSAVQTPRWSLGELRAAIGGTCDSRLDMGTGFDRVSTDSRAELTRAVFFALRGERFDGHEYVAEALRSGAVAAVIDDPTAASVAEGTIVVTDTLRALGDFAAWVRRAASMSVIAITGSNGKTTTKELTASICEAAEFPSPRCRVLKTEGNLNNLIGLPMTLLRSVGDEAVAVLEMGMNRPGEIDRLTEIARPDVGVITNIGRAHLQGVGSLAGVAEAKGELFARLPPESSVAVNTDDPWVVGLAERCAAKQVRFGSKGDVRAENVVDRGLEGSEFDLRIFAAVRRIRLPLVGIHNIQNALAAAATTTAIGIPIDAVASGLERPSQAPMRMEVRTLANGVTILNDAYNANPSSMKAALETLQRLQRRCVAVLGQMRELGDESQRAHREIGEHAGNLGIDLLVAVGESASDITAGAVAAGMSAHQVVVCGSAAEAADVVRKWWAPGDVVLVKGSRGAKLEDAVRALEAGA